MPDFNNNHAGNRLPQPVNYPVLGVANPNVIPAQAVVGPAPSAPPLDEEQAGAVPNHAPDPAPAAGPMPSAPNADDLDDEHHLHPHLLSPSMERSEAIYRDMLAQHKGDFYKSYEAILKLDPAKGVYQANKASTKTHLIWDHPDHPGIARYQIHYHLNKEGNAITRVEAGDRASAVLPPQKREDGSYEVISYHNGTPSYLVATSEKESDITYKNHHGHEFSGEELMENRLQMRAEKQARFDTVLNQVHAEIINNSLHTPEAIKARIEQKSTNFRHWTVLRKKDISRTEKIIIETSSFNFPNDVRFQTTTKKIKGLTEDRDYTHSIVIGSNVSGVIQNIKDKNGNWAILRVHEGEASVMASSATLPKVGVFQEKNNRSISLSTHPHSFVDAYHAERNAYQHAHPGIHL